MEGKKVSGIYIPGMEMPKNCYECPIRRRMGLYIICSITKKEFSIADVNILFYRLENCPLIPVPDHGDLIERDAAKELMKPVDSIREREPEWTWGELHESYCKGLDSLPTIIPADKEVTE